MSHAFSPTFAKPAFGTYKENLYQSDYLNRKKAKHTYCITPAYCNKLTTATNYAFINSFRLGRYARGLETCNIIPVNKGNLIMGQYTKMDLKDVCTASNGPPPTMECGNDAPCDPCQNNSPVILNQSTNTTPFYWNTTVDPLGNLYGRSQCGELNYTHYMIFNP